MAGFDIDELMSIKNAYQGQRFQWIKPAANERAKLATVVTVTDVVPGPRVNTINGPSQRYIAVLSDHTKLDTEHLTSNLMMLHEDQQAMTVAEVQSIYMEPSLDLEAVNSSLPTDMQALSTLSNAPSLQTSVASSLTSDTQPTRTIAPVDTKGLFGMFSVEDTELLLKLSVKLPAKNLLKMMYTNSQDKDQFIDQLSAHINNSITQDAIKIAIGVMMGQDKKKKIDD